MFDHSERMSTDIVVQLAASVDCVDAYTDLRRGAVRALPTAPPPTCYPGVGPALARACTLR